jgi:hypothetical protein
VAAPKPSTLNDYLFAKTLDVIKHFEFFHHLYHGGALSSWDDQRVAPNQFLAKRE